MLRIRDSVLFDPWIWDPEWKSPDLGSGINILEHISESVISVIWVKIPKFFVAYRGSGALLTLDPESGMENLGSGIRNKHKYQIRNIAAFFVLSMCSA